MIESTNENKLDVVTILRPVIYKYLLRFCALFLFIWLKKFFAGYKVMLGDFFPILMSVNSFIFFLIVVNICTSLLIMIYRLRKNLPYKYTDNVVNGINNLYYLIVTFGLVLMFFGFWGIDFYDLVTSLSIVAAAIAILSKDYVGSVISGIIISFSGELNIDDYVKIGETKGKIVDIKLSKVLLLNDDDDIIYIPNERVYLSDIINYTKKQIKKVSVDFEIDVKRFTSIEELEKLLANELEPFIRFIEPNSFNVKIVEVKHEYLELKLQYVLLEVNRDLERLIRKKSIRAIANSLNDKSAAKNIKIVPT